MILSFFDLYRCKRHQGQSHCTGKKFGYLIAPRGTLGTLPGTLGTLVGTLGTLAKPLGLHQGPLELPGKSMKNNFGPPKYPWGTLLNWFTAVTGQMKTFGRSLLCFITVSWTEKARTTLFQEKERWTWSKNVWHFWHFPQWPWFLAFRSLEHFSTVCVSRSLYEARRLQPLFARWVWTNWCSFWTFLVCTSKGRT